MKSYNVAVYGATGHTGRFVAAELERGGAAVRRVAHRVPTESISPKDVGQSRVESFMNEAPLEDLRKADSPPPTSARTSGRSTQTFVMDVFASGEGRSRRLAAFGCDIYAVSAPLVVEACMRVLSQKARKGGTFAPAELFDPCSPLNRHRHITSGIYGVAIRTVRYFASKIAAGTGLPNK